MKQNPDFAKYLSDFLMKYLPGTLNVSKNTIASYRDTFKLFLLFMEEEKKNPPNKICLQKITYQNVIDFLDWIEKKRSCSILRGYLKEQNCNRYILDNESPLFFNQQKQKLTRKGVSHILNKYVSGAKENPAFTRLEKVTCHILRHSRAAHMIQAGIPLIYIRDFLGHASVQSTEIYYGKRNIMESKLANSRI